MAKRGEASCNRKPRERNHPGCTNAVRKLGETRGLAEGFTVAARQGQRPLAVLGTQSLDCVLYEAYD